MIALQTDSKQEVGTYAIENRTAPETQIKTTTTTPTTTTTTAAAATAATATTR